MNRYSYLFFSFVLVTFLFIGFNSDLMAQREVEIAPTEFGILNKVIDGDTTATGERVDLNTVYVLERGTDKYYLLDGSIENDYPLHIISRGEGDRPKLVPGVVSGGEAARPFRPRADVTLEGLYVTSLDQLGGLWTNQFRISANDATIRVNDCFLDNDGQSIFRLDSDGISVFVTNSIIANVGRTTSPDNGRVVDTRGNEADSIWVENCTIYNVTSRLIRDGGGTIRYANYSKNTIVNVAQWGISFGQTAHAIFADNMLVNCQFYGNVIDTTEIPRAWVNVDSLKDSTLLAEVGKQTVLITNNNFYLSQDIIDAYPDSVQAGPLFNATAQAFIDEAGTGSTMLNEAIVFTDAPAVPVDVMLGEYTDRATAPQMDTGDPGDFGTPGFGSCPFDFAYSSGTASYTASTKGLPLGDLNWFPEALSIDDPGLADVPQVFHLGNNYPNPFNPTTTINYQLNEASKVSLTIYNALGQVVRVLVNNDEQMAGAHQVQWNGRDHLGNIVASGVYLYKLQTNEKTQIKKMLLLK
jgi:hypothetical protein